MIKSSLYHNLAHFTKLSIILTFLIMFQPIFEIVETIFEMLFAFTLFKFTIIFSIITLMIQKFLYFHRKLFLATFLLWTQDHYIIHKLLFFLCKISWLIFRITIWALEFSFFSLLFVLAGSTQYCHFTSGANYWIIC